LALAVFLALRKLRKPRKPPKPDLEPAPVQSEGTFETEFRGGEFSNPMEVEGYMGSDFILDMMEGGA
jgi:hypothetical protein